MGNSIILGGRLDSSLKKKKNIHARKSYTQTKRDVDTPPSCPSWIENFIDVPNL